jgi:hypothetical protein
MTQNTAEQSQAEQRDPGLADLAHVIAEKFERSVEANLGEARWWMAEADTETYPQSYRAFARARAAQLAADAEAEAAIAARARAAVAAPTAPTLP